MFKKLSLACVTAAALVATSLTATAPASADAPPDNPTVLHVEEYEALPAEDVVEVGLEDEGLDAETVEVGPDGIEIAASAIDPADDFAFALQLAPGGSTGTYTVTDEVDGTTVTTAFDVNVLESTVERSLFELTNQRTGEVERFDSASAATSIVFLIPVAFAAISLSTALYYIAIGAAIVIGGVLALEAAKAISRIIADNNRKSSSQRRNYYPATRGAGVKLFISPQGMTKAQALNRGKALGDVWAISQATAKALCRDLNVSKQPEGWQHHISGQLRHYHPAFHKPNMHCFYGGPVF